MNSFINVDTIPCPNCRRDIFGLLHQHFPAELAADNRDDEDALADGDSRADELARSLARTTIEDYYADRKVTLRKRQPLVSSFQRLLHVLRVIFRSILSGTSLR